MKAIYLATALLALGGLSASAQTVVNNPNNRPYFGIRASLEIPCPGDVKIGDSKHDVYKNGVGVDLGFVYNVPVVANFYIEPGINFYYNAYGIEGVNIDGKDYSSDVLEHASVRESGFRIPVSLGYHFDFTPDVSLAIFTGPELDVGFSSDRYITTKEVVGHKFHSATSNYGDKGNWNRVGCNWTFGVGFNLARNYYVGIRGAVGLVDINKSDHASFKKNRVDITLGYNF